MVLGDVPAASVFDLSPRMLTMLGSKRRRLRPVRFVLLPRAQGSCISAFWIMINAQDKRPGHIQRPILTIDPLSDDKTLKILVKIKRK